MDQDILAALIGDVASAMVNCPDAETNKRLATAIADACAKVVGVPRGATAILGR